MIPEGCIVTTVWPVGNEAVFTARKGWEIVGLCSAGVDIKTAKISWKVGEALGEQLLLTMPGTWYPVSIPTDLRVTFTVVPAAGSDHALTVAIQRQKKGGGTSHEDCS